MDIYMAVFRGPAACIVLLLASIIMQEGIIQYLLLDIDESLHNRIDIAIKLLKYTITIIR